MKRKILLAHLEKNGCKFLREGAKHTVYVNTFSHKASTIPRHNEINDLLARKICKDLDVPFK